MKKCNSGSALTTCGCGYDLSIQKTKAEAQKRLNGKIDLDSNAKIITKCPEQ